MRKIKLTFILTVLMSMVGLQAYADFDTSTKVLVNGLYYYLDLDNKLAQVTEKPEGKYTGNITIPSSFTYNTKNYSVTSIGEWAFYFCSDLTSITIPNSVTSIGYHALQLCTSLTSITIPNSVTEIGERAFSSCEGLTSITIPNSVTSIGDGGFWGCSSLTSVTIGNSVTSIGKEAFRACNLLTSVTIPNSVTSIGNYAFAECDDLTSVTIPNSVTSIGESAFYGTGWYNNQPDGLVYAGKVAYKYKGTMPANTSITLDEGTPGISGYAFSNCSGLESVTIPKSVTSIGTGAFYGCSGLTSVTVDIISPLTITANTFTNRANATLYVIGSSKSAYEAADYWKEFKEIVELSVSITLNSLGKGTYCSKYPLDFTSVSGIAAYIICGFKPSAGTLSTLRVFEVPAETGLYIVGTPGSTYNIPVRSTDFYYTSMMKGVTVATDISPNEDGYDNYVLASLGNGGVIFRRLVSSTTMGANKAYVQIPSSAAEARAFFGIETDDDSITGLGGVFTPDTEEAEGDYYNLSGQKVQTLQKGIYIKNGKKIIIH